MMCHRFALKTVNKNPIWRRSFYLRYRLVTQAQYEGTQPMGRRRRPVGRLVCVDKFKSNHSLLESLLKVQYCAMPLGHLWAMPLPMLITTQIYSTGTVYHIVLYHVVKINFHARPSNGRQTVQLTKDGGKGLISHGIPDWVYEEEVFEQKDLASCLWWSTAASNLAYASFYDAKVNRITLNR